MKSDQKTAELLDKALNELVGKLGDIIMRQGFLEDIGATESEVVSILMFGLVARMSHNMLTTSLPALREEIRLQLYDKLKESIKIAGTTTFH